MGKINIELLTTHNSVATMNDISLSLNENEYYIVAGEENATEFEISYSTAAFSGYTFYVSMVNAKGYGIDETAIVNDKFTLPTGMAVAGYGYIMITAKKDAIVVAFMPVKIKVHNTVSAWRSGVSAGTSVYVSNGHLYYVDDDGNVTDLGNVMGVGIDDISLGQDGVSFDFDKTDGTTDNVPLPTIAAATATETEVATLVASSIEIGTVVSGTTPSVSVVVSNGKANMSFVLPKGTDGTDGSDGTTFTPSVSSAGVISWTNDGGEQNPQSVDLVAAVIAALPVYDGTGD